MTAIKESRTAGFLILAFLYLAAIGIGGFVFLKMAECGTIERLFLAGFWATVFIWFVGVLFRNSSIYAPYWGVAPPVMLTGYAVYCGSFGTPVILLLMAVWVWGICLTVSWACAFRNLAVQEQRYDKYKNKFLHVWPLVNFFGLHLMPTLVVFLVMVPGFRLIELDPAEATIGTYAGCLLCLVAVFMQGVADVQGHRFRKTHTGQVCTVGLWKYVRHPNYAGGILMWGGVYCMLLSSL